MKKYIGITVLLIGVGLLVWFHFFKDDVSKTGIALSFFTIAIGARFLRVHYA